MQFPFLEGTPYQVWTSRVHFLPCYVQYVYMSPSSDSCPCIPKMVVFTDLVWFLPFDLRGLDGPTGSLGFCQQSSLYCQNTKAAPPTTRFSEIGQHTWQHGIQPSSVQVFSRNWLIRFLRILHGAWNP